TKYPTLNLVYLYMELLKKRFGSKAEETIDTYLNLIYEEVESKNNESDKTSNDDIPATDTFSTTGLLNRVRATINLSIDKLWAALSDIALIAIFLDPRELKINLSVPDDIGESLADRSYNDDSNFFQELEADFT
ncbi:36152_t:CDS:2, partial [Racocetra persica]